jgi:hypothetical protein
MIKLPGRVKEPDAVRIHNGADTYRYRHPPIEKMCTDSGYFHDSFHLMPTQFVQREEERIGPNRKKLFGISKELLAREPDDIQFPVVAQWNIPKTM